MNITVKITNLAEIERKLNGKFLYEPEIEPALDSIARRGQRGGRGLGARRNPIMAEAQPMMRTLMTTLRPPRTTGYTWRRVNLFNYLPRVARNALNKAARAIAGRWGQ